MKYKLLFDSETGGLNPETADILTVYMAMVDENLRIVDELDLKLKPDDGLARAEAQALAVNGINLEEHLKDPNTITYSEAKRLILNFFQKYREKGKFSNITPLGHNIDFDINYVTYHLVPKDEWNKYIHYGKLDTKGVSDFLKEAGWFPRDIGNLGSLVKFFNVPARDAHNAKEDSLMCLDVYKKIIELLQSKKEGGGSTTSLISLLEAE